MYSRQVTYSLGAECDYKLIGDCRADNMLHTHQLQNVDQTTGNTHKEQNVDLITGTTHTKSKMYSKQLSLTA